MKTYLPLILTLALLVVVTTVDGGYGAEKYPDATAGDVVHELRKLNGTYDGYPKKEEKSDTGYTTGELHAMRRAAILAKKVEKLEAENAYQKARIVQLEHCFKHILDVLLEEDEITKEGYKDLWQNARTPRFK